MKKIIFLSLILSIFLCSCSGLFTDKNAKNSEETGKLVLNIDGYLPEEISKSDIQSVNNNARLVTPAGTISDVTNWNIVFSSDDYTKTEETDTLSTASFIFPVGTYNISVKGTSDTDTTLIYVGSVSGIEIKSNTSSSTTINVQRQKTTGTDKSTGTLNYSVALGTKVNAECTFSVSLSELGSDRIYADSDESPLITAEISSNVLTVTGTAIPSGYYKLAISYSSGDITKTLKLDDPYIEIADGCTTTGSFDASKYSTSRTYYASTSGTANGINEAYPIKLSDLLANLTSDSEIIKDLDVINIYIPDADTEDLSTIDFNDYVITGKTINVYSGDFKIFENGYIYNFYVAASGSYTDSNSVSHKAYTTLHDVAAFIESNYSKCGYKNQTVNICVSGTISETQLSTFSYVKGVNLYGATTTASENIIDYGNTYPGNTNGQGISFDNSQSIEDYSVTVKNLTIENAVGCTSSDSTSKGQFAGLKFSYDKDQTIKSITIDNCVFTGNTAGSVGESIFFTGKDGATAPETTISNCSFKSNGTTTDGVNTSGGDGDAGVIRVWSSLDLTVSNCTFEENDKSDIYIKSGRDNANISCVIDGTTSGTISIYQGVTVLVAPTFTGSVTLSPDYTCTAYTNSVPVIKTTDSSVITNISGKIQLDDTTNYSLTLNLKNDGYLIATN